MKEPRNTIERTARAELDLIELAAFFLESSDELGTRFALAVHTTAMMLLESPGIGRLVERPSIDPSSGLRWWPVAGFPNHLVFYREIPCGIILVRVLHGARDWPSLIEE